MKNKDTYIEEELGKTRVMSLSTLSIEVTDEVESGKSRKNIEEKGKVNTADTLRKKSESVKDNSIFIHEPLESIHETESHVAHISSQIRTKSNQSGEDKISEEIRQEKNEKEFVKMEQDAVEKSISSEVPIKSNDDMEHVVKIQEEKAEKSQSEMKVDSFCKEKVFLNDKDDMKENAMQEETPILDGIKNEKQKSGGSETLELKESSIVQNDAHDIRQEKMTLEEKRKEERSKLMTIEERRKLQRQGKLPVTPDENKRIVDVMGKLDYVLLILSVLMSWFVAYRIYSYFSWGYALIFFFIAHTIFAGIFLLSKKKRKIGLGVNICLCILMLVLSLFAYRMGDFTDQVFDNSETEMVMLVAKKDSPIMEKDDFKDKKIAFIKSDGDTNTFAKEMLTEAKKENYKEIIYVTYKEAYDALMSEDVDMMVYTSFTKQRLAEDDIQSWDEIKVVMQKNRALKAVESKKVDISKDPFNIYISGVDLTSENINEKGSSDVNIIMTINPKTKKLIMQTIPRDTWVGLTCSNGEHTKLTYAGAYGGIDCSINTIEEYLDVEINYYAKINFQGVIDLVDAFDGITVNSDVSFCEAHSLEGYGPKNYCYNEGANTLDGAEALMFARIRKVFSDGDIERGRHQMEVINAVIREFNASPSLSNINALLGAVETNFTTNLEEDDIGKGIELFLGMGKSLSNIDTQTMEGKFVWKTDEITNEYLYYFVPNDGQVELVKQRIQDVMDGK